MDFKVTFDTGAVTMVTELPVSRKLNGEGRSLPHVKILNFDLNFDPNKIHISLSGGVLADILETIVWIFKHTVIGEISKIVDAQVPPSLENAINSNIESTNGFAPLMYNLMLDF
jgi:hypothetical protein